MSFLSTSELAQMRADVVNMLPDLGTIQAVTLVSDGAGGNSQTWAAIGTVACRVDPLNSALEMGLLVGAEGMRFEYQVTFPYNASISVGNRLVTGGYAYEIKEFSATHSWNVSVRAKASRVV